ncbi:hypothetical protein GCM10007898_40200 [Dyella flagellata]|uniref:Uncharacterized protein n=1 Tax=Dyella flagellata TaxID=1867833 RepID=A0ABQ5XGX3_9GAMM|nr:hypothetical protein GCM10007898_40200 [Dyella flagellata]
MGARLQRDISGGRSCLLPRFTQCIHFGMRLTRAHMPALPYHTFAMGYDAAHAWIGLGSAKPLFGQA